MHNSDKDAMTVKAFLDLTRDMKLKMVAEGMKMLLQSRQIVRVSTKKL